MSKRNKQKKKHNATPARFHLPAPSPNLKGQPNRHDHLYHLMETYIAKQLAKKKHIGSPVMRNQYDAEVNAIIQQHTKLHDSFIQKLTSLGMNHDIKDVQNMDTIDLSFLSKGSAPNDIVDLNHPEIVTALHWFEQLHAPENWFASLPCFKEGAIRMNKARWLLFNVQELQCDNGLTYKMHLIDYDSSAEVGGLDGVSFDVTLRHNNTFAHDITNVQDFSTKYSSITPAQLGWNKEQVKLWEEVTLQNAVDQKALFQRNNINPANTILALFSALVITSNYYLSNQKPTIEKEPKQTKSATKSRPKKPYCPPDKRIRHIGTMRFISKQIPKTPTEKTVRHWHVEQWTVRGHVRHYKSGKTVYIQPTVKHRKQLQHHNDQKPIQNILVFQESDPNSTRKEE